jgi:hypothetical protein
MQMSKVPIISGYEKLLRACNLSSGFQFNTRVDKEVRQAQHDTVAVNQQGLPLFDYKWKLF